MSADPVRALEQRKVEALVEKYCPEGFATATAEKVAALSVYDAAKQRRERAQADLDALSCRTAFTYEVEGPGEDDVFLVEENCALPVGHTGEHRGEVDESGAADPAYTEAFRAFRRASVVAHQKLERWEVAEDALDSLRCNQGSAAEWPCILRRGHEGAHVHPSELRVVL